MPPLENTIPGSPTSESEADLVFRAQSAVSQCNWVVGECAAYWTQRYAKGRTDADFGQLVGLSGDQVYQRRRVWETFGDVRGNYASLKWSHYYVSLTWDDAPECLQWAEENQATVAEMKMWRRALLGDEASDDGPPDPWAGDPTVSYVPSTPVPVRDLEGTSVAARDESGQAAAYADLSSGRVGKEANEVAYAPFRKNAGSAGETETAGSSSREEMETEQLIKRLATTLERINKALTPRVLEEMADLPGSLQKRFRAAVEELRAKASDLVS